MAPDSLCNINFKVKALVANEIIVANFQVKAPKFEEDLSNILHLVSLAMDSFFT